ANTLRSNWDAVRSQTARPPRKPRVQPLPKASSGNVLHQLAPSSSGIDSFAYLAPELVQQRVRHENSFVTKLSKLFCKKATVKPAPPAVVVRPATPPPTELEFLDLELELGTDTEVGSPSASSSGPGSSPSLCASGDLPSAAIRERLKA
ncbi:hypothetical protein H0H92_002026, partial [Tricholoma furcatifolium]